MSLTGMEGGMLFKEGLPKGVTLSQELNRQKTEGGHLSQRVCEDLRHL